MRRGTIFLAGAAILLVAGSAHAYPQWQFSSGTSRCNQCHFNPAGGGLITGYGRDAAGEELSSKQGKGNFLHGAVDLPDWLALGGDLRGVVLRNDNGSPKGTETAVFPMQADAYGRVSFLQQFSLSATLGYRGQARSSGYALGSDNYQPESASSFISREHYLMWRQAALGPYVRIGRFFAPYGLRLSEHPTYIRRDLGYNLLQENYGLGAGIVKNDWELHVTGFVRDFLRQFGSQEAGGAALCEKRLADMAALGLSARAGFSDDLKRYQGGPFGKVWIEKIKTLLMAEGDFVSRQPTAHDPNPAPGSSNGFVGYAGLTVFPVRGLWLGVNGERSQTDIKVRDTATNAVSGQINWFPYPHFELILWGRLQDPTGNGSAKTGFIQLHYYL